MVPKLTLDNFAPCLFCAARNPVRRRSSSTSEMRNLIHQHAVFCPAKERIEASLDSVQRYLKLSDTQLRNMALNFPEIITYSFDNNIRPKLNVVQNRLLLSDGKMQKVVLTLPKIFCYDFDGTSNPSLKFLQDHLNLTNNEL